jgi:hypothetical protein
MTTEWQSRCESGSCIQTREVDGLTEIRDSEAPEHCLRVPTQVWAAYEAALRAEGRQQAADAIVAHRDRYFPPDSEAQRRGRRHLNIAVQVASPPITLAEVGKLLLAALAHDHDVANSIDREARA